MQDLSGFACGRCKGHFIPGDALDRFLSGRDFPNGRKRLMERALESPASARELTCPSCRANSFRVVREGVVAIDVCDLCTGLYLDRGEASLYLLQTRRAGQAAFDALDAADLATDVGRAIKTIWDVIN